MSYQEETVEIAQKIKRLTPKFTQEFMEQCFVFLQRRVAFYTKMEKDSRNSTLSDPHDILKYEAKRCAAVEIERSFLSCLDEFVASLKKPKTRLRRMTRYQKERVSLG